MTDRQEISAITVLTKDGRQYLHGDWPDVVGFSVDILSEQIHGMKITDQDIELTFDNGSAIYRKIERQHNGDWICRKIKSKIDAIPR